MVSWKFTQLMLRAQGSSMRRPRFKFWFQQMQRCFVLEYTLHIWHWARAP